MKFSVKFIRHIGGKKTVEKCAYPALKRRAALYPRSLARLVKAPGFGMTPSESPREGLTEN